MPTDDRIDDDPHDLGDSAFDPEFDLPPEPAAKKPAAKSPAPKPDEPARPKHPVSLVQDARRLGFSQADIDGADTADLRAAVAEEKARIAQDERDSVLAAAARPAAKEKAEPEVDEFDSLEADGFDPKIVAQLRRLDKANKELAAENKTVKEHLGKRERAANEEKLDEAFAALGEKYAARFGDGPAAGLGAKSDEMANRLIVLRAAGIDPTQGLPSALAVKQAVARVVKLMGELAGGKAKAAEDDEEPNAYEEAADPKLAARQRQFREGGLAEPTDRKSPKPKKATDPESVRKRGERALAERMKLNGQKATYEFGSEEDSLPD